MLNLVPAAGISVSFIRYSIRFRGGFLVDTEIELGTAIIELGWVLSGDFQRTFLDSTL